jgi:dUTP pyrophosphatase
LNEYTRKVQCLLSPGATLPKRANPTDAGADLFYNGPDVIIAPGEKVVLDTGVAMKIPVEYGGFVLNRSSQRKAGITSLGTGLIDSDYRGTIKIILVNTTNEPYEVTAGERIGQLVIIPVVLTEFVDTWNDTQRGTGNFGSTGR